MSQYDENRRRITAHLETRTCAVRLMKIIGKLLFYIGRSYFGFCSSKVSKGRERLSSYALGGRMFSFIEKKKKNKFSFFIFKCLCSTCMSRWSPNRGRSEKHEYCGSHLCLPFFLKQIRTYSVNGATLFKKLFLAFPFGL